MKTQLLQFVRINNCVQQSSKPLFMAISILLGCSTSTIYSQKLRDTPKSLSSDQIAAKVDQLADSVLANTDLPGMLVGVWSPRKKLTYVKGKGLSDTENRKPMTPEQYFRIGSNTKTFVVTAIMQLSDEKKLSLDDRLSKYFPDYPNGEKITLRMLGNMTSGIPSYTMLDDFQDQMVKTPLRKWKTEELIGYVKNQPLMFEPGTKLFYCNTNTILLGAIIEKVTGNKASQELENRFFKKLKLKHTFYPTDEKLPPNSVHGYWLNESTHKPTEDYTSFLDPSWAGVSGAVVSNIFDVKTWVESMIGGKLNSKEMQQERFVGHPREDGGAVYAMGNFTNNDRFWGHNGGLPGYTSIMMHNPKSGDTVVIFYNWQNAAATPDQLYQKIVPLLK